MTSGELFGTIFAAVGGAGILLLGLGAWLGKVWASRIAEAEKAFYAKELEQLKLALDLRRRQQERVSEAQFKLYSDVWSALQDLKSIGDRLWERVTLNTLQEFLVELTNARAAVNRGRLILTDHQYQQLHLLLSSFERYRVGKLRLLEIRSGEELEEHFRLDSEHRIRLQIHENQHAKVAYEPLLDQILQSFRHQLGLVA